MSGSSSTSGQRSTGVSSSVRHLAYVGLGANLGEAFATVTEAMAALAALPGTRLLKQSSLYRSAPIGHADQPDFINAVVALDTGLTAEDLHAALEAIERRFGRERSFANAPRTLDLDLLLYDSRISADPRLTLPHPRMHERAFVLAPLIEIAPESEIPGRGRAVDHLARCLDQFVERL